MKQSIDNSLFEIYSFHMNPINNSPLLTTEEHEQNMMHQAESYAENAWLRHAESPANDYYAFEKYEKERCPNWPL